MNFYIGNSISEINFEDENVEFSDDLQRYISIAVWRRNLNVDIDALKHIDSYADVLVSMDDTAELIRICEYFCYPELWNRYKEPEEALESLVDLKRLGEKALRSQMGLVSIGD